MKRKPNTPYRAFKMYGQKKKDDFWVAYREGERHWSPPSHPYSIFLFGGSGPGYWGTKGKTPFGALERLKAWEKQDAG